MITQAASCSFESLPKPTHTLDVPAGGDSPGVGRRVRAPSLQISTHAPHSVQSSLLRTGSPAPIGPIPWIWGLEHALGQPLPRSRPRCGVLEPPPPPSCGPFSRRKRAPGRGAPRPLDSIPWNDLRLHRGIRADAPPLTLTRFSTILHSMTLPLRLVLDLDQPPGAAGGDSTVSYAGCGSEEKGIPWFHRLRPVCRSWRRPACPSTSAGTPSWWIRSPP